MNLYDETVVVASNVISHCKPYMNRACHFNDLSSKYITDCFNCYFKMINSRICEVMCMYLYTMYNNVNDLKSRIENKLQLN